jgi:hypothetical protein
MLASAGLIAPDRARAPGSMILVSRLPVTTTPALVRPLCMPRAIRRVALRFSVMPAPGLPPRGSGVPRLTWRRSSQKLQDKGGLEHT